MANIRVSAKTMANCVFIQSEAMAQAGGSRVLKVSNILDLEKPIRRKAGEPLTDMSPNRRLFLAFTELVEDQAETIERAIAIIKAEGFEAYEASRVAQEGSRCAC